MVIQSDHFTSHNRDSLYIRQLILLTDLYGKTRTPDGDLYGRDLEMLLQSVRRAFSKRLALFLISGLTRFRALKRVP